MKNKKGQGMSISTIILLVLGVIILVILVLGFSRGWNKVIPGLKPQFTITENVCEEQKTDYMTIFGLSDNTTILIYDYGMVSAPSKKSLKESLEIAEKGFNLTCEQRQGNYFGSTAVIIQDAEQYRLVEKSIESGNVFTCFETEQSCNKKEVDKIPITRKIIRKYNDGSMGIVYTELFGECKCSGKDCPIYYSLSNAGANITSTSEEYLYLSKQDLNVSWLSQNAECVDEVYLTYPKDACSMNANCVMPSCSRYQLNTSEGNYTIEVKR